MGVDYAIIHPTPDDQLGVAGRMQLLKTRRQVESLTAMVRARGDQRPLCEISIEKRVQRLDGRQETVSVSLQQMLDQTRPLDAVIKAAGSGARYEYGFVAYPIAEAAEPWLLSLLPEDLASSAGTMLTSCVRDFGYDGGRVREMRASGPMFFARREPIRRTWRTPRGEWTLNSDQALQLLIGLGPLQPTHVVMLALMFGLMPHTLEPAQLKQAMSDIGTRQKLLVHAPLRTPPNEARELAGMMEKLRTAAACNVILWVDS